MDCGDYGFYKQIYHGLNQKIDSYKDTDYFIKNFLF